jgi:ATP-dependent DNA helicase RecG
VLDVDADEIEALAAAGESFMVEFKVGTINDSELVEAVACLANGSGGQLLIGVVDDGTVKGARPRHGRTTDPVRLQALIANKTEPSVAASVELVKVQGHSVIAVTVPSSAAVIGTVDGRYVRRAIDVHGRPQCLPMRPHEVLARAGSTGAQDYTAIPVPAVGMDDLASAELTRFRDLARAGGDGALPELSDGDLLQALGLLTIHGELTTGAVLLFGQPATLARHVPTHEIAFQVLELLEVRVNRMDRAPLLKAMVDLTDQVQTRNPEEEIEIGLFRVGLPRFAEIAVREVVANALVHRDYTSVGAVHVQIDDDVLRVSNPGGFPEGVTTSNLLVAPPRPRNPLVADAFKRAGLVERTGRGINRVFESQLAIGRPAPDYSLSTDAWVEARLRAGPADRDLAGFIAEARRDGQRFSLQDLLVLHEVRHERRITSARAAELFQVSQDEARAVLNRLVERGLLEARGERKGRTYHLAAGIYRKLGQPGQYVRTRGFDDLQQEQMVLTFVDRHGSITRADAAELCRLGSDQASRLLRRLRDEGKLALAGERRASRYTKPT